MPVDDRPTVYSTEDGFEKRCRKCGDHPCRCPKPASLPPQQQTAYIQLDRKGRGGKTVTVIRNLQLTDQEIKALAQRLKQACGSGGTVKNATIEIQGDQRDKVSQTLRLLGYKTKNVGG